MKTHSGDLLAAGCITSDHIEQIHDAEESLIEALVPYALELTEGFTPLEGVLGEHPILGASAQPAELVLA